MSDDDEKSTKFGCQTPWSEPSWYDESLPNPYYTPDHIAWRNKMRDFVESEIIPNVEQWESGNDTIPMETYRKAAQVGLLAATVGYPEGIEGIPPRPQGWDGFMTVICQARRHLPRPSPAATKSHERVATTFHKKFTCDASAVVGAMAG